MQALLELEVAAKVRVSFWPVETTSSIVEKSNFFWIPSNESMTLIFLFWIHLTLFLKFQFFNGVENWSGSLSLLKSSRVNIIKNLDFIFFIRILLRGKNPLDLEVKYFWFVYIVWDLFWGLFLVLKKKVLLLSDVL